MKKVLAMSSVLLGVVFLAGCGQQPVSQTRPTTPAPVAQTPTQPVATQPAQQPVASNPAENKIVYTNNEYKFKIALPEAYKEYRIEEIIDKDAENAKDASVARSIKEWVINIKTTAKEFAPEYYEASFIIAVQKADIWDKTPDCAGLLPIDICYNKEYMLGKKDNFVFYLVPSQDRSEYGQKVLEDFVFSQKIKQNFQLF